MGFKKLLFSLSGVVFFLSCSDEKKITVLAAAGLKEPLTALAQKFEKNAPKTKVELVFSGSGSLLVKLKNRLGDLYIPAAESYIKEAQKEGLIDPKRVKILAYHIPVLVVRKGLPIKSFYDLLKENIKLGISDPKEAAIGKVTYKIFKKAGIWEKIQPKIKVKAATVNQLILYFNTGQIDAALIWKELASKVKDAIIVEIPKPLAEYEAIPIGITAFSQNPKGAQKFENFLLKERELFRKYGFFVPQK